MTALGFAIKILPPLIKTVNAEMAKSNAHGLVGALTAMAKTAAASLGIPGLIMAGTLLAMAGIAGVANLISSSVGQSGKTADDVNKLSNAIYKLETKARALENVTSSYADLDNQIIKTQKDQDKMNELLDQAADKLDEEEQKAYKALATNEQRIRYLEAIQSKAEQDANKKRQEQLNKINQLSPNERANFLDPNSTDSDILTAQSAIYAINNAKLYDFVDGLEDAEVLEIIDHHRVADIQTSNPIFFRNEPIGSTSTIVAKCFFERGLTPSKTAAGLLCSAIISDTLLFRSPTCTPQDEEICRKLAEIAGISSVEDYAKEMFKAGTSLKGKTVEQIFNQDYKPFSIEDIKVGIAQVNTMDIDGFMPLKEEMLAYMNEKAKESGLDMVMLLLTDIITEGSQVLVVGERPDIAEKAFNVTLVDNTAFLPGVLSRKKQVVPPVTNVITNA